MTTKKMPILGQEEGGAKRSHARGADAKTLMTEQLPAPDPVPPPLGDRLSPRERARRRLSFFVKQASVAGAAGSLAACTGFGVVDPLPTPVPCTAEDNLASWVFADVEPHGQEVTLNIRIESEYLEGLTFADVRIVDGEIIARSWQPGELGEQSSITVGVLLTADMIATLEVDLGCEGQPDTTIHFDLNLATLSDGGSSGISPREAQ